MIIHIIGSLHDRKIDPPYFHKIIETIHDMGGVLAHNWIEAHAVRQKEGIVVSDWKPYVEKDLDNIRRADIVIAELTHYTFSQGFLVAAALGYKKPILAVSRFPLEGTTAANITDALFTRRQYSTEKELTTHIKAFIKQNTIHTKDLRFNMFLTRNIYKHLEEISHETGKNKSEIIRQIIKRKVQKTSRNDY